MAPKTNGVANGKAANRKRKDLEEEEEEQLGASLDMPVPSDSEDDHDGEESDGEADEFPEIDPASSNEESSSDAESDGPIPIGGKVITSEITGQPKRVYNPIEPDYDSDSSTEEDPNRIGNVPAHWYDDLPHIGYTIDGKKVLRPARGDELDKFLSTVEDPSSWTSALDKSTMKDVQLSAQELDIIRRLQEGENPTLDTIRYEDRPCNPGWPNYTPKTTTRTLPRFYELWSTPADADHQPPLPAPKPSLPTTAESYNPPEEYLPTPEETKEWEETEKQDREQNFCLKNTRPCAWFLLTAICSRTLRTTFGPLFGPKSTAPASLRPFPTHEASRSDVANTRVRCAAVSPDGAWILTGDESGIVRLWEMLIGREAAKWTSKQNRGGGLVSSYRRELLCRWSGGYDTLSHSAVYFAGCSQIYIVLAQPANLPPRPESSSPSLKWTVPNTKQHPNLCSGDYFASVSGNESQGAVWIHQTSKRHSQAPFRKVKGAVQCVLFHPTKPHFFVAICSPVRPRCAKIAQDAYAGYSLDIKHDVHPSGDHIVVGGYDRKLCWFDLELSSKPYKVLRYHSRAIRDDGTVQVFHARVYNDLMTDPLIVPLKVLRDTVSSTGWVSWTLHGSAVGVVGERRSGRKRPAVVQLNMDIHLYTYPPLCRRKETAVPPFWPICGLAECAQCLGPPLSGPTTTSFQVPRADAAPQLCFQCRHGPRAMINGPMTADLGPNQFQQQQIMMQMMLQQQQGMGMGTTERRAAGFAAPAPKRDLDPSGKAAAAATAVPSSDPRSGAAQQAQLQAQIQAAQAAQQAQSGLNNTRLNPVINRRVSAANAVPSTAGPGPMTAAIGGRFGTRAPSLSATTGLNPNAAAFSFGARVGSPTKENREVQAHSASGSPPHPATTVISGGTSLGGASAPAPTANRSQSDPSWRRPSQSSSPESQPQRLSPPVRDQSPISRARPQPLRFISGCPPTRGPPSEVSELGPRNFASRVRSKAIGGLEAMMLARNRRQGLDVEAF
ncbi:Ribosome biogenesis protein YTM1 [Rhizoctonia solani]|uniref:Ribosome biogenesis protein YTM1 n=1 Tax=Rhizoctonia solani TaxID=456999 RepID=A0A8H7M9H4_9AGAM|nr:Ribosome biogenesis protein YTM1 [Rhizoctonia solani]